MATYYGVQATKYAAVAAGTAGMASFVTQDWDEPVHVCYDSYISPAGAETAASVLTFGRLPKGARPLFFLVNYTGVTTAVTCTGLAIGSTAASTAITTMATTGHQVLTALQAVSSTPLTAAANITMTTADATIATAGEIEVTCFYMGGGIG